MRRIFFRINHILWLMRNMQWRDFIHKVGHRIYSKTMYYGMSADLSEPVSIISAAMPVKIREYREEDRKALFEIKDSSLPQHGITERVYRLLLLHSGLQTCYVTVTADGSPCAALWLMPATENTKIQNYFSSGFPVLTKDEMLMEGLFTLETYRNKKIMAASVTRMLSKAREAGARRVIAFVHSGNIQSIRTLRRAGFITSTVKREQRLLFFRWLSFKPLVQSSGEGRKKVAETLYAVQAKSRWLWTTPILCGISMWV